MTQQSRRNFVKAVGGVSALAALGTTHLSAGLFTGPSTNGAAETAVGEFYKSLSDAQKSKVCFDFNHKLRSRINANWHITEEQIGFGFYSDRQKMLIDQVVRGLTSKEGYKTLIKQMEEDDGGMDYYAVAVFGNPEEGKFEFELTGRHLTIRADGNSVDKAAFGGPIVYGHGDEDVKANLYYPQTKKTNEVFKSLDAEQAKKALVTTKAPKEAAVQIQGKGGKFPGIAVGDLQDDQKKVVHSALQFLLAPYREEDRKEVMQIVKESGGVDALHMAFYTQGDLGSDKTWDIWRVEGPSFVWHFRGAPHVHAYINIAHKS
ncbi:MAG TPA: hypothetical protein DCG12_15595 [Planctomycetaceae bacterium]|nr:hypothetical protein [Planctomycetaceae bacterium]